MTSLYTKGLFFNKLRSNLQYALRTLKGSSNLFAKSQEEIFDVLYPEKQKHIPFDESEFQNELSMGENEFSRDLLEKKTKESRGPPIIKCKRAEFNHFKNQSYDKFKVVPLASSGWHHKKSKGDYFTIDFHLQKHEREAIYFYDSKATFSDLGLSQEIKAALEKLGIVKPTKIQFDAIPVILSGQCSILAAETGCGKTLAFLLPVIEKVMSMKNVKSDRPPNHPLALVITPSRELAQQIYDVAASISNGLMINTKLLIGGHTKRHMLNPKFEDVDILIATIGVVSKLTSSGIYNMSSVQHVVLDEADTLLDDSFSEYLVYFLRKIPFGDRTRRSTHHPKSCQLTLASATMPKTIPTSLNLLIPSTTLQKIEGDKLHYVLTHVPQQFLRMSLTERPGKLLSVAKQCVNSKKPIIVFSNRSPTCDWVSMFLNENGVKAINLNGDMPYNVRIGKFEQFQSGEYNVLSCTDIGSRGLDTTSVKQILNYDFPMYIADYIHRCGRTGRMGLSDGCVVTNFVTGGKDVEVVQQIETAVRKYTCLPDVSGNITRLISNKIMRNQG